MCFVDGTLGIILNELDVLAFRSLVCTSEQVWQAMSEGQQSIYHFYLDYLNFCGPASGAWRDATESSARR